jgi:hypothetical protein
MLDGLKDVFELTLCDVNNVPYIEKVKKNMFANLPKEIKDFYKKPEEPKRKNTKKYEYVKGAVEEIASEDPDGKKVILNKLWINKNIDPTGNKLNYYKKKG